MKIETKLNRKSTITKALLAGSSLAMLSFLTPSAWAVGVSTSEADLSTPTLTGLNLENSAKNPNTSAYNLIDITDDIDTTEDLDSNGIYIGTDYDFVIKKYLESTDNEGNVQYISKYFSVNLNDLTSGEAVSNASGETISLSSDYVKIYTSSDETSIYGGVISNAGTISLIDGSFVENAAYNTVNTAVYTDYKTYGAAIYNEGTITEITGDFIYNYVETTGKSSQAYGGAICSTGSSAYIGTITGDFVGNYAISTVGGVHGGAIYNASSSVLDTINGDFIGNYIYYSSGTNYAHGGAIYNTSAYIYNINGDFIANYVETTSRVFGGAISNSGGVIYYITGNFIDNYVTSSNRTFGGAIYNTWYIYSIEGDFMNNYAINSTSYSGGGAIYNKDRIYYIAGDFIGNYTSAAGYSTGGAIYNEGTMSGVYGDFIANHAIGESSSYYAGGAVYNEGEMYIEGDFIANYILGATGSYNTGGAVYNEGGTMTIEGAFVGNYLTTTASSLYATYGGAVCISDDGEITFSATTSDITNVGNWVGVSESSASDSIGGFLYISGYSYNTKSGVANFDIADDYTMTIGNGTAGYDSIASYNTYATINKTGDGDLIINSSILYYKGALNIKEGLMTVTNSNMSSSAVLTIYEGATFAISADSLTCSKVTNYGSLNLLGGTFTKAVAGTGSINAYGTLSVSDLVLVAGSTFNAYGVVVGDIDATDADVNAIITGDNAAKTIFTGTLTGVTDIDVSIGDIGASLNTETLVYSDTANTDIVVAIDEAYSGYVTIDYDANTVTIGESITYTDDESGAEVDVYLDTDSNIVVDVTSEVDYTVSAGDSQTIDYIDSSTTSSVVLDGGTINTGGSMVLASDTENETSYLQVSSGTIETTSDDASVVLLDGTTSIAEGETFEIVGNLSVGDTESSSEVSSTLGSADSTLVLTDTSVSIAENSSLSLVSTTISGDDASFTGEDGSSLALGSVSASTTISLNSLDTVSSEAISSTASTALSLSKTALDGASVEFSASDEAKTAVEITDESSVISGDVSTTYTSTSEDASSTDLTAIKTSSGTITLDKQTTVSALLTDTNGDEIKATALTNVAGTGGLTVNLLGEATINGNIVANSPFILNAGTVIENGVESAVEDAKLTVYGSISTGDAEDSDDATITGATLVLSGENASLSTYYDGGTDANENLDDDTYGALTIKESGALIAEDGATVIVGATSIDSTSSLSIESDSEMTITGIFTVGTTGAEEDEVVTITLGDGSSLTVDGSTTILSATTITGGTGSTLDLGTFTMTSDLTLENIALNGTLTYDDLTNDTTVNIVSDSDATISGTLTVENKDADNAITLYMVTDSSGVVRIEDGADITLINGSTDYIVQNDHDSTGDNGLTLSLEKGSASFTGGIIQANSPLTIAAANVVGDVNNVVTEASDYVFNVSNATLSTVDTVDTVGDDITVTGVTLNLNTVIVETDGADLNLIGAVLNLTNTDLLDVGTINLEADSVGTMSKVNGTTLANNSITVVASASMLKDDVLIISDDNITNAVKTEGDSVTVKSTYDNTNTTITVDSLTYFQEAVATTANESTLAYALDNISANGGDVSDKIDFKVALEVAGLDSVIMSANSYIAEVNTMLLSNQNFANVNRARAILAKSNVEVAMTEVEVVEEATGVSVVESEEIEAIKYSNVAQLQVISLMGNKNASNGVAGYEYYSVGSTANFDEILSDNALIGVSIGGTYNKVEGDAGDNANSTTFLLNAYAVYAYEGFEFFGNIGYAHFWNEGSKAGASADWDSDAFNGLVGVSYKMETALEGLSISPVAMLNLVCQDADSASYSNGVNVDDQSYFSAKLMLGFEVEYAISAQFNVLARAMYSHEMGDTSYDNTYGFANGFVNGVNYIGSEAGADSAVMGLGLSYDFSEACTAYFDYNAYAYTSLITHSLNLSVAFKF